MMRKTYIFLCILFSFFSVCTYAQDSTRVVKGMVLNAVNNIPLENVNIVNLDNVTGTSTNENGSFKIKASPGDRLYFTRLGFEDIRIKVSDDWFKFGEVKIKMTEVGIALEKVVLNPINLTGYLEIDAKNIPIYHNYRYSIAGLNIGYEGGDYRSGTVSDVLGAIFNPINFLHHVFGKRPRQMRKLQKMRENDEIRRLLKHKFDRETLAAVLGLSKVDINEILRRCEYSKEFIKNANDLQILDAINRCYQRYKVLQHKN